MSAGAYSPGCAAVGCAAAPAAVATVAAAAYAAIRAPIRVDRLMRRGCTRTSPACPASAAIGGGRPHHFLHQMREGRRRIVRAPGVNLRRLDDGAAGRDEPAKAFALRQ